MLQVDLNADVGEADTQDAGDAALMPFITSANIACGVHAGNAEVMAATVSLAVRTGVAIGAHPGLNDRANFGRRELPVGIDEVKELVTAQVSALVAIAAGLSVRLRHVKPHGALYNMAARDMDIAAAIAEAVADIDRSLILVGLSGSALIAAGRTAGLSTASEAFADRAYRPNGLLDSRSSADAVLHDPVVIATRAVAMVRDQQVIATDGTPVPVTVETICIHGDTPGAATIAQRVRAELELAGVQVSARTTP
jgi:5-oxoprolinase (ATP-hydrolysing) subunit A